ncbi:GNAT family N-acetyltransferase [Pedobacter sp. UBA5917]|jgi:GNAT superfamily N-acetyltransferase|uniref:GNAT family N-acetyltransferase n=1 Tax=Pedobacter sp. UBA5917 TaxID=1947061 RepID=UPI0025CEDD42|nr:GNAT family N-acetyltransferase [Pedobacter sp. UBA5917]
MHISNSTTADIAEIFRLYENATAFQKTRYTLHWPKFETSLIETEIKENRQWKITIDGKTACVWATTFDDPQIWEEKNADPSVYIHRIATSPEFKGQNMVAQIVTWAKGYAKANGKIYVRLDTVGQNEGLIKHYTKMGFEFLGLYDLKNTDQLPSHYHGNPVSLFELLVE